MTRPIREWRQAEPLRLSHEDHVHTVVEIVAGLVTVLLLIVAMWLVMALLAVSVTP